MLISAPSISVSGEWKLNQEAPVRQLTFCPDGRLLASADEYRVTLWDLKNLQPFRSQNHEQRITSISFSPDGKLFAIAGGGTINVWEAYGTKLIRRIEDSDIILTTAFLPDNKQLLVFSRTGPISIWDCTTGNKRRMELSLPTIAQSIAQGLHGSKIFVHSAALNNDGAQAAIVLDRDSDQYCGLVVVSLTERQTVRVVRTSGIVDQVCFSPDGSSLLMGVGGRVREEQRVTKENKAISVKSSYRSIVLHNLETQSATWDAPVIPSDPVERLRDHFAGNSFTVFHWIPSTTTIALAGWWKGDKPASVPTVLFINARTGKITGQLIRDDEVFTLAGSRDGSVIAVGGRGGIVTLHPVPAQSQASGGPSATTDGGSTPAKPTDRPTTSTLELLEGNHGSQPFSSVLGKLRSDFGAVLAIAGACFLAMLFGFRAPKQLVALSNGTRVPMVNVDHKLIALGLALLGGGGVLMHVDWDFPGEAVIFVASVYVLTLLGTLVAATISADPERTKKVWRSVHAAPAQRWLMALALVAACIGAALYFASASTNPNRYVYAWLLYFAPPMLVGIYCREGQKAYGRRVQLHIRDIIDSDLTPEEKEREILRRARDQSGPRGRRTINPD